MNGQKKQTIKEHRLLTADLFFVSAGKASGRRVDQNGTAKAGAGV